MKSEIEVRILNVDIDEIIGKIEKQNGLFVGDWEQKRYVYDFNPKQDNKWIRLRTNGKETTLTIKEIKDYKIDGTKELEIIVNDFEETNRILAELGYRARSVQENRRIRYILDGVEIDIDTWPGLNTFVEFEGQSEESIKKVIQKLGMKYEDSTTLDVHSIYLSKGYKEKDLNILKFDDEFNKHIRRKEK